MQSATDSQHSTLAQACAEIDTLPTPDNVDAALWSELQTALKQALADEYSGTRAGSHVTSSPPQGNVNRVTNLRLTDESGQKRLRWSYVSIGDYDQNGEVGSADLVPIAQHFGESGPFDFADALSVIDGDGNGEIGSADIVPIAQNFGNVIHRYQIEYADGPEGQWTIYSQVHEKGPLTDASIRQKFSLLLPLPASPQYARIKPVDHYGYVGVPSWLNNNPLSVSIQGPSSILDSEQTAFQATASGYSGYYYDWSITPANAGKLSTARGAETVFIPNTVAHDVTVTISVSVGASGFQPRTTEHSFTIGHDDGVLTASDGQLTTVNNSGVAGWIDVNPNSGAAGDKINFTVNFTANGGKIVDILAWAYSTNNGWVIESEDELDLNYQLRKINDSQWSTIGFSSTYWLVYETSNAFVERFYCFDSAGNVVAVGDVKLNGGCTVANWKSDGLYDDRDGASVRNTMHSTVEPVMPHGKRGGVNGIEITSKHLNEFTTAAAQR